MCTVANRTSSARAPRTASSELMQLHGIPELSSVRDHSVTTKCRLVVQAGVYMGSSSKLPGLSNSNGKASADPRHRQGAPHERAKRASRAHPQSSISELLDGEARYRVLADQ